MTTKNALLIGVDFGTTYSGVAWSWSGDHDKINIINNWPGSSMCLEKVPTSLSYNRPNSTKCKWGFEVESDRENAECLTWFKLLLDQDAENAALVNAVANMSVSGRRSAKASNLGQLETTATAMRKAGKKPVDLVVDYLRKVHEHTMATLRKTYPDSFTVQLGHQTPIKYCLTVPAVWSDKAKELTLQAAKRAGMSEPNSEIRLISEPEAAAVHCFKNFHGTDNCLKVGDIYVIADCGGGTVDLISYEITALTPRLKVKECVAGTGGLCGSTSLNRRFEDLVKTRIGAAKFASMGAHARMTTYKHFDDYLKQIFLPTEYKEDLDDDEEEIRNYHCPLPNVPANPGQRVNGGFLLLSEQEMKDIFMPTFNEITQLIQEQVRHAEDKTGRSVTGVLLVGGFGSSQYLYKHLSKHIKDRNYQKLKILQPQKAWSAIVRGAVADSISLHRSSSEEALVQSRVARFSYGTVVSEVFIPGVHPTRNRYFDELDGLYRCSNRMLWLVKKGRDIPNRQSIKHSLIRTSRFQSNVLDVHEEEIYCSKENTPPGNFDDPGRRPYKLCIYKADFRKPMSGNSVPLTRKTSPGGETYWSVEFDMTMHYNSHLTFSTQLAGQDVGTALVEYNHEYPKF